uniref:Ig-like domain-containing protein n=1 Tax=Maylandia zebra TaxID=106582 RepID=A0A3P9D7Y7_9CICH
MRPLRLQTLDWDTATILHAVIAAIPQLSVNAQKDNVLQAKGEETAAAGGTVTLDCLYNSSSLTNDYLYWYKQDGNNSPKFILMRYSGDQGNTAEEFKERFSSTLDSSIRSVPLKIQKLQLSDSAVYYCALQSETETELLWKHKTV